MDKKKKTKIRVFETPSKRSYLNKVYLQNFKSHKDLNEIELAPMVNLIFGKNSSGKSSIIQSLRLFRQSYSVGNYSPINLEPTEEFRNKGGISFDIEYKGLVHDGKVKNSLGLGVGVGSYEKHNEKIEKQSKLFYEYKYVKNFYKGKALINDKTIPSQLKFENGENTIVIDFVKTNFYNPSSGESLLSARFPVNFQKKEPYEISYSPYYFDIKLNSSLSKLGSIEKTYNTLRKIKDKQKLIKVLNETLDLLKKDNKQKKDKKKNKLTSPEVGALQRFQDLENPRQIFAKNIQGFPGKKGFPVLEINKRIELFLKNPSMLNLLIQSVSKTYLKTVKTKEKNNLIEIKIKRLINVLNSKEINNKDSFVKIFTKDIFDHIKKEKNIKFFRGEFVTLTKDKALGYRFPFDSIEDEYVYLINLLNWIFFRTSPSPFDTESKLQIFPIYDSRENVTSVIEDIERCMNKMVIVPGLRSLPKRYFVRGMSANYIGQRSENLAEILSNENVKIETNYWLKKLEIPYTVGTQKSGNYVEIVFKKENSKLNISQNHIGLGYPLILPFIVQCLIGSNQIIVAEEPEIHLHPKIEADLAELVVWSSLNRANQFIIETHSEEFLLRLLKNIREKKVKPDQVSINYVDIHKGNSKINKIFVQSDGSYKTPWKDDLFAERSREFI